MKKYLLFVVITVCGWSIAMAQGKFHKGYLVDNVGNKSEVFFKKQNWKHLPEKISFKYFESSSYEEVDIKEVQAFGVNGEVFERFTVEMDMSAPKEKGMNRLSRQRGMNYETATVFLRKVVEGKLTLYVYDRYDFVRFFVSGEQHKIEQLVYKEYMHSSNQAAVNDGYKQQLINLMDCEDINTESVNYLRYDEKSLIKIFKKYYHCVDPNAVYEEKEVEKIFYFNAIVGVGLTKLKMKSDYGSRAADFPVSPELRLGVEFEYVVPYSNHKWGLFLAPSYHSFKKEMVQNGKDYKITYNSLEIAIGGKYYSHISKNTTLVFNMALDLDITFNSEYAPAKIEPLEVSSAPTIQLGAGMRFKNKHGFDLQFIPARNILNQYPNVITSYSNLTLKFVYNIQ